MQSFIYLTLPRHQAAALESNQMCACPSFHLNSVEQIQLEEVCSPVFPMSSAGFGPVSMAPSNVCVCLLESVWLDNS